jgi:hypothetical protein
VEEIKNLHQKRAQKSIKVKEDSYNFRINQSRNVGARWEFPDGGKRCGRREKLETSLLNFDGSISICEVAELTKKFMKIENVQSSAFCQGYLFRFFTRM